MTITITLLALLALGIAWLCYERLPFVETVTAPRKILGSEEPRIWMFSDVSLDSYPAGTTARDIIRNETPQALEVEFANRIAITYAYTFSFQNARPKMYNLCSKLWSLAEDTPFEFPQPAWMNETNFRGGYSPPRLLTAKDLDQPLKEGGVLLFLWD